MEDTIRGSTRFHFEDNHFFQELPQRLKQKLVNCALIRQKTTFEFFFEDFGGKNKASDAFMIQILTHLDSSLYSPGKIICDENQYVDQLVVVGQGKLNMYGYYEHRGERKKMMILHLPEQSWYGDFQILLKRESSFQLEAGQPNANSTTAQHFV